MKNFINVGIGVLIDQKLQGAISIEMFQYSNSSFSETTFLTSSIKVCTVLRVKYFGCFFYGTIFDCVPSAGILMVWKCSKGPFDIHILSIFKLKILWNYWLEFFRQGAITGFFLEMSWSIQLVFFDPLGWNCGSATGPLGNMRGCSCQKVGTDLIFPMLQIKFLQKYRPNFFHQCLHWTLSTC